jgi:hypothetical protein
MASMAFKPVKAIAKTAVGLHREELSVPFQELTFTPSIL